MTEMEKTLDRLVTMYARRSVELAVALRASATVMDIYCAPVMGDQFAGLGARRVAEETARAKSLLDAIDADDAAFIASRTLADMPDRPKLMAAE